ncbi:MAG: sialate O-acetylesterase [Bacteroidales bacterium]|nr:sialate O-acetylesterase [Candidatus Equibacterium intestinale]
MKRLFCMIALLGIAICSHATLRVPDVISSNMVLQQQTQASIWGWADAGAKVTVITGWNSAKYNVTAAEDGSWMVKVNTPRATYKPETIVIRSGNESISLENVLIGEVWVCSGQSNMDMPMGGYPNEPVEGSPEIIRKSADAKGLRMCVVDHVTAFEPQQEVGGRWKESSPENTPGFTATAYMYARALEEYLHVPVGIISCAWGGANIKCYMSKEALLGLGISSQEFEEMQHHEIATLAYSVMYNAMIYPLHNYTIKGFLWYQGCANLGQRDYADYQNVMANEWRSIWGLGDLPFYYAQIAPFFYGEGIGFNAGILRDEQTRAESLMTNAGMVATYDLVYPFERRHIHPRNKAELGRRFATLAADRTYGIPYLHSENPKYESFVEEGNGTVTVKFTNMGSGFWEEGEFPGFMVAGEDKVFYPADNVSLVGTDRINLGSSKVEKVVAVRYLWDDFVIARLWNSYHLPILPFRTDNWDK